MTCYKILLVTILFVVNGFNKFLTPDMNVNVMNVMMPVRINLHAI